MVSYTNYEKITRIIDISTLFAILLGLIIPNFQIVSILLIENIIMIFLVLPMLWKPPFAFIDSASIHLELLLSSSVFAVLELIFYRTLSEIQSFDLMILFKGFTFHLIAIIVWSLFRWSERKERRNRGVILIDSAFSYALLCTQATIVILIYIPEYKIYDKYEIKWIKYVYQIIWCTTMFYSLLLLIMIARNVFYPTQNILIRIVKYFVKHKNTALLYLPLLTLKKAFIIKLADISKTYYSSFLEFPIYIFIGIEIAWLIYILIVLPFRNKYVNNVSIIGSSLQILLGVVNLLDTTPIFESIALEIIYLRFVLMLPLAFFYLMIVFAIYLFRIIPFRVIYHKVIPFELFGKRIRGPYYQQQINARSFASESQNGFSPNLNS